MAKRFTETEKWKDPWFRKLEGRLKLLWMWLCDQCDGAGVIDPDLELAAFQIGITVSELDLAAFNGRLNRLENGKWMLSKFISFQYGELSETCPAHKPVFRSLENNRVLIPIQYPINRVQDKDKDKDKVKDKEKDGESAERGKRPTQPRPTLADVVAFCQTLNLPKSDAEAQFHKWEGNGWTNGGKPIKNWQATIRSWQAAGYMPSQKTTTQGQPAPTQPKLFKMNPDRFSSEGAA